MMHLFAMSHVNSVVFGKIAHAITTKLLHHQIWCVIISMPITSMGDDNYDEYKTVVAAASVSIN